MDSSYKWHTLPASLGLHKTHSENQSLCPPLWLLHKPQHALMYPKHCYRHHLLFAEWWWEKPFPQAKRTKKVELSFFISGNWYGPDFMQSYWLISDLYHTIRNTFFNFCRKWSIFSSFRCSGIENSQNSTEFLSCLIFGHLNTGQTICKH